MTFYCFDESKWPFIILTVNGKPNSQEDFKKFLKEWEKLFFMSMQKCERFKLMFDLRKAKVELNQESLIYAQMMSQWLKNVEFLIKSWLDRTAMIVNTKMMQQFIYFVMSMKQAVRPYKIFYEKELDQVMGWLNKPLDSSNQQQNQEINLDKNSEEFQKISKHFKSMT